jgi:hypothetical protein
MAVSTDTLRAYLGLMPDDTADLTLYLSAAKSKAQTAGIPDFENNAQYDIFLLALAAMYYDNRGMTYAAGGSAAAVDAAALRMIESFVWELRYAGEDDENG